MRISDWSSDVCSSNLLTVVSAADANQLRAVLRASVDHPGAMYIRLGRGRDPVVYESVPADFAFGKAARLRDGRDITIVTMGRSEEHTSELQSLMRISYAVI